MRPDPEVVELARGLLQETLHGKPPLESTMELAEEILRLSDGAPAPRAHGPRRCARLKVGASYGAGRSLGMFDVGHCVDAPVVIDVSIEVEGLVHGLRIRLGDDALVPEIIAGNIPRMEL